MSSGALTTGLMLAPTAGLTAQIGLDGTFDSALGRDSQDFTGAKTMEINRQIDVLSGTGTNLCAFVMSNDFTWAQWAYASDSSPSLTYVLKADLTTLGSPTGNIADVQSYGLQLLPYAGSVVSASITDLKIY